MREQLQLGYNIVYGTGDTVSRAISVLVENMRAAYDSYDVTTIGGISVKDDGKERFRILREVYLTPKGSGASVPVIPGDVDSTTDEDEIDDGTL